MANVMVMKEIEDTALRLGVDLSTLDLDAIRIPPDEDCSIVRYQLLRPFQEAKFAKEKTHGYKLDRAHILP
ncbi:hypothetical protein JHK86_009791 [Glycine max]|nr:hypothetical protein JHK86_009791 [Glycine max]